MAAVAGLLAAMFVGSANANTIVSFSAFATNADFVVPLSGTIDDRQISLDGVIVFSTDIVDGTYGIADLVSFSLDMHRSVHPLNAAPAFWLTADYSYALSDLNAFSLTFVGGVATAGSWTLAVHSPDSFSNAAFVPLSSVDLDSAGDPSLTFYQVVGDTKSAIAKADFDRVSTSTGSIPEPASIALVIGGLGMIGSSLRRRAG